MLFVNFHFKSVYEHWIYFQGGFIICHGWEPKLTYKIWVIIYQALKSVFCMFVRSSQAFLNQNVSAAGFLHKDLKRVLFFLIRSGYWVILEIHFFVWNSMKFNIFYAITLKFDVTICCDRKQWISRPDQKALFIIFSRSLSLVQYYRESHKRFLKIIKMVSNISAKYFGRSKDRTYPYLYSFFFLFARTIKQIWIKQ